MTASHAQLRDTGPISEISQALEAWRLAVRDLVATTPGTADRLRAEMVEAERRLVYQDMARVVGHDQVPEVAHEGKP